jgi:hypothetical protein
MVTASPEFKVLDDGISSLWFLSAAFHRTAAT